MARRALRRGAPWRVAAPLVMLLFAWHVRPVNSADNPLAKLWARVQPRAPVPPPAAPGTGAGTDAVGDGAGVTASGATATDPSAAADTGADGADAARAGGAAGSGGGAGARGRRTATARTARRRRRRRRMTLRMRLQQAAPRAADVAGGAPVNSSRILPNGRETVSKWPENNGRETLKGLRPKGKMYSEFRVYIKY